MSVGSKVRCGTHGERLAAVVCGHLKAGGPRVGFVENSSEPRDLQAWCDACEALFVEQGGLTDRFRRFNAFVVVCDGCYADLRARHGGATH